LFEPSLWEKRTFLKIIFIVESMMGEEQVDPEDHRTGPKIRIKLENHGHGLAALARAVPVENLRVVLAVVMYRDGKCDLLVVTLSPIDRSPFGNQMPTEG
jgi:hypothetical protein